MLGNKKRGGRNWAFLDTVPLCKVSCFDLKQVKHTVEVSAGSVYEAVAQALRIFRDNNWVEDIGHGQTRLRALARSEPPFTGRDDLEESIARVAREGQLICAVDSP